MPLIPRSTVIDRPTLVDREDSQDEKAQENNQPDEVLETLGDGGGPTINQIEFEEGDYGVVSSANLVAALSTAQTEGHEYHQAFVTAAVQMKEMAKSGVDIGPIARMGRDRGVDDLNVSQRELSELKLPTEHSSQEEMEDGESEESDTDEEDDTHDDSDESESEDGLDGDVEENNGEETS